MMQTVITQSQSSSEFDPQPSYSLGYSWKEIEDEIVETAKELGLDSDLIKNFAKKMTCSNQPHYVEEREWFLTHGSLKNGEYGFKLIVNHPSYPVECVSFSVRSEPSIPATFQVVTELLSFDISASLGYFTDWKSVESFLRTLKCPFNVIDKVQEVAAKWLEDWSDRHGFYIFYGLLESYEQALQLQVDVNSQVTQRSFCLKIT